MGYGYHILFWLQEIRTPALDAAAEAIRFIAEPVAIALVLGFFYWCADKTAGRRMALIMFSGTALNAFVKNLFRVERPFKLYPHLAGAAPGNSLATATGYSLPSGHTQNIAAFGGLVCGWLLRRRWIAALASLAVTALVAFSRMYIGAHTPADVAIGAALGYAWLFAGSALCRFVEKKGGKLYNLLFFIPGGLSIVTLFPLWHGRPPETDDAVQSLGLLAGTIAGVILEEYFIRGFTTDTTARRKAVRMAVGLTGAAAVYLLFKLLPDMLICDLIRSLLLGLWLAAGLPWLAVRLEKKGKTSPKETVDE